MGRIIVEAAMRLNDRNARSRFCDLVKPTPHPVPHRSATEPLIWGSSITSTVHVLANDVWRLLFISPGDQARHWYTAFSLTVNTLLTQSHKSLPRSDIPMNSPNPLQPLYDLDRTSPQFHKHLTNFFRRSEYQNVVPSLKSEDLTWLVEYLDSVSLPTISPHSVFNTCVGSRRYFRSCDVPGILARTQQTVWR